MGGGSYSTSLCVAPYRTPRSLKGSRVEGSGLLVLSENAQKPQSPDIQIQRCAQGPECKVTDGVLSILGFRRVL